MGPSGFIALLAGWFTTEVGRQPWVVYGVLHTKDALSPVSAEQVGLTLIIFVSCVLCRIWYWNLLHVQTDALKDHSSFILKPIAMVRSFAASTIQSYSSTIDEVP